jgi:hypothetical protein
MRKAILISLLSLFLISFVYAEVPDVSPVEPESSPYVKELKCIDTDGGINYYEQGMINYEVIEWDAPDTHIPPESGEMDSCVEAPKGHESYLKVRSVFVREKYCEDSKTQYVDYDCSSEGKVCYEGACVGETDEIKESNELVEKEREEVLGFWSRIFYFFSNPSGKASFSKTMGEVKDSEGNMIGGAKVTLMTGCGLGHFSTGHSLRETVSDDDGKFEFDSFKVESVLSSRKCSKAVSTNHEGYCGFSSDIHYFTCLRTLKENDNDFSNINDVYYIQDTIKIKSNQEEVSLILKKVDFDNFLNELDELEKEIMEKGPSDISAK